MRGPMGYGHGMMGIFGAIVGFLGTLILIAIVVGVLFFLIRFLIVGTKAAQLYIEKNRPAAPISSAPSTTSTVPGATAPGAAPAATTPAAATSAATAPSSPAKPAPKPRTPKTPPSPDL